MIQEYKNLLNEKYEILKKILYYTKSKTFEKCENEVERIEYYLQERQSMYDNLLEIQRKIEKINVDNAYDKEVESIIEKSNCVIKDILKLDERNKETIEFILNVLKKEIRNTKNMSKANNGYLGIYQNTIGGNLFDSSR